VLTNANGIESVIAECEERRIQRKEDVCLEWVSCSAPSLLKAVSFCFLQHLHSNLLQGLLTVCVPVAFVTVHASRCIVEVIHSVAILSYSRCRNQDD